MAQIQEFIVIVPAAGVGKRMQANCPKQYLCINNKTILTHTVMKLLNHERISKVIISLGANDQYFSESELVNHPNIIRVEGGKERVDSVLNGLKVIDSKTFKSFISSSEKLQTIWVQILESFVLQQMERERDLLTSSPIIRYQRVLKRSPQVFQEIPNKYIASYLRMTPETLSRIKKS